MFHVALFEPEIPYNTGNISRLCVGTNCSLTLVGEPGFSLEDSKLKRAGLDHWDSLSLRRSASLEDLEREAGGELVVFSTYGERSLWQHDFEAGQTLLFGSESRGLPAEALERWKSRTLALPLPGSARSLNLSNAVAIAVYEGLRQLAERGQDFPLPRSPGPRRPYFDLRP